MNDRKDARRIDLDYRLIRPLAFFYMSLPLILFLLSWLHPALGVVLGLFFVVGTIIAAKPTLIRKWCTLFGDAVFPRPLDFSLDRAAGIDYPRLSISYPTIAVLILVALAWCLLGGHGGFWAQSSDWGARNAVFYDLITHSWPVYYNDRTAAMSYYMAFWLPAALAAKLLLACGLSVEAVWPIANIMLFAWTASGVVLVELLVLMTVGPRSTAGIASCVALLILFSTPDVLGLPVTGQIEQAVETMHLEWWARGAASVAQYSSITTCLFWVFNQSVVSWICTLCFLNERNFSCYFFLWACCLNCGPFPCLGLAVLMFAHGMGVLIGRSGVVSKGAQLRSIVSLPNLAGLLASSIVIFFFASNSASASTGVTSSIDNLLVYPLWLPDNRRMIITALVFVLFEGLLLPALLLKHNVRKPLFWAIVFTLLICPFIRIGQGADFCMRASIPAILSLCILCILRLHTWRTERCSRDYVTWALIFILALGACTPIMEFYRGINQVVTMGVENARSGVSSLEGSDFSISNFGTENPEDKIFFRYLSG